MTTLTGKRLATGAVLVFVFGAGGLLGFVVGNRAGDDRPETAVAEQRREWDGQRRPGIVHRLDLSEGQQARVDSILEHRRVLWAELQKEIAPRYREVVEGTQTAIRSVLTAEQEATYDSLLAEARERRRRADGGPPSS